MKLIITESQLRTHIQNRKLHKEEENETDKQKILRLLPTMPAVAINLAKTQNIDIQWDLYPYVDMASNNGINTTDAAQMMVELMGLTELKGQFAALPDEVGNLRNLQKLFLVGGNISELPETLLKLKRLTEVVLTRNRLDEFPMVLTKMPWLERIGLLDNSIAVLPPEIGNITNLKSLNIAQNELSEIPPSITKLSKLKTLLISRNHIPRKDVFAMQKHLPNTRILA